MYVADVYGRVQKFSSAGVYLGKWSGNQPTDVVVHPSGDVYVADGGRIVHLSPSLGYVEEWPGRGGLALAMDPAGEYIYVTRTWRIAQYRIDGTFVRSWLIGPDSLNEASSGIACGPDGSVYVGNITHRRVQRYDSSGNFLSDWQAVPNRGLAVAPWSGDVHVVAGQRPPPVEVFSGTGTFLGGWGEPGTAVGQFYIPGDIAIGSDGSIYVTDSGTRTVNKYRVMPTPAVPTTWGQLKSRYR